MPAFALSPRVAVRPTPPLTIARDPNFRPPTPALPAGVFGRGNPVKHAGQYLRANAGRVE